MSYVFQCSCGVRVEGDADFVKPVYDAHLHCHDSSSSVVPKMKEPENPIVRRVVTELSAMGSPLRSRLNAAAADLAAAGYSAGEIAARLESGEHVDV